MKQIKVVAKPDGTVVIEAEGFSGPACLVATEELEKALGLDPKQRKLKPEYGRATVAAKQTQER